MALFTCRDAALGYDGGLVVRDLNFTVAQGDYLCIIGENGAGKSTLMKGLLRLKSPSQGEILIGDGLKAGEIGYVPQQSAAQKDFPASVFEVVLSGLQSKHGLSPFYSKAEKAVALENMEKLGIVEMKKDCYRELSGGQQQRTLLARALCATGTLLLLDEPVAGLDPVVTQELYGLIAGLNRAEGLTIIMISHDVAAIQYASHVLHLQNRQLFFGEKSIYMETELAQSYLGGGGHA